MVEVLTAIGFAKEGLDLLKTTGELLGVVESIEVKVDLLKDSELKTGLAELQQAMISKGESKTLLRSARGRFNKATTLEKGYKLCLTYLCLAFCHRLLGDTENCRDALKRATLVENHIDTKKWALAVASDSYNPLQYKKNVWDEGYGLLRKGRGGVREIFRRTKERNVNIFKKSGPIGPATEKLLEDQNRIRLLQDLADRELQDFLQASDAGP